MAKFKGWKNRYSYLEDYRQGLDGKYVYYGRHYILQTGKAGWKSFRLLMGTASVLILTLLIITGIIEAGAYWRLWYVNLAYALKVIAAFLIIWKSFALITEKYPVKKYIYKKSVPWYRPCAMIEAITGGLCAIAAIVCILAGTKDIILSGCIIEIILNLVTGACGFVLFRMLERYSWDLDPSEENI